MKCTFFRNPLEIILELSGEAWKQGDPIKGKLVVKNLANQVYLINNMPLKLCFGTKSKFKILDEIMIDGQLGSEAKKEFPFQFILPENSLITEKSSGFYIFYDDHHFAELKVFPHDTIINLITLFENLCRFKVKSLKNKKGYIEATFTIPSNKEYSALSSFKVLMILDRGNLDLIFQIKAKKVSFAEGEVKMEDKNFEFQKTFLPNEYMIYGSSFNQEKIFLSIKEIIDEVKIKPLL